MTEPILSCERLPRGSRYLRTTARIGASYPGTPGASVSSFRSFTVESIRPRVNGGLIGQMIPESGHLVQFFTKWGGRKRQRDENQRVSEATIRDAARRERVSWRDTGLPGYGFFVKIFVCKKYALEKQFDTNDPLVGVPKIRGNCWWQIIAMRTKWPGAAVSGPGIPTG